MCAIVIAEQWFPKNCVQALSLVHIQNTKFENKPVSKGRFLVDFKPIITQAIRFSVKLKFIYVS